MPPYGFSLVELMIAIVVLGIGLVMVATIFPVAIMQTREAVELSLAPAIADQAIATLKARLATWNDFNGDGVIDPAGAATQEEAEGDDNPPDWIEGTVAAVEQGDWPNDPFDAAIPPEEDRFFPIPAENFLRLPVPGETVAGRVSHPPQATDLVMRENLEEQQLAWLAAGGSVSRYIKTKIAAFERVYHMVQRTRADGTGLYATFDPQLEARFLLDSARRRFAWRAFSRRTNTPADRPGDGTPANPPAVGQRVFQLAIFVLRRSEPALRFPAQEVPLSALDLSTPAPAAQAYDTIFPQPWLVLFDDADPINDPDANYKVGRITCFRAVSELLPPGSIFIDFATGHAHKVLSVTRGPGVVDVMQLAPDPSSPAWDSVNDEPVAGAEYAWVFPPNITRRAGGSYGFASQSPVVEVFRAQIAVD